MTEAAFGARLRTALSCKGVHTHRIETTTVSGMPDILAYRGNKFLWIETKLGVPKLRPAQMAFLAREIDKGTHACVISEYGDGTVKLFSPLNAKTSFASNHHKIVTAADYQGTILGVAEDVARIYFGINGEIRDD